MSDEEYVEVVTVKPPRVRKIKIDAEEVIKICCEVLEFVKNEENNFKKYIRRQNFLHLPTRMAFTIADLIKNSGETVGKISESIENKKEKLPLVKEYKKIITDLQVERQKLQNLLDYSRQTNVKNRNTVAKAIADTEQLRKENQMLMDKLKEQLNKSAEIKYKNHSREDLIVELQKTRFIINKEKPSTFDIDDTDEMRMEIKKLREQLTICKRIPGFNDMFEKANKRYLYDKQMKPTWEKKEKERRQKELEQEEKNMKETKPPCE